MEDTMYDRNSFQRFLTLDLWDNTPPDETSILSFRHLLEAHDLATQIFEYIAKHFEDKQFLMKSGTLVNATLIDLSDI